MPKTFRQRCANETKWEKGFGICSGLPSSLSRLLINSVCLLWFRIFSKSPMQRQIPIMYAVHTVCVHAMLVAVPWPRKSCLPRNGKSPIPKSYRANQIENKHWNVFRNVRKIQRERERKKNTNFGKNVYFLCSAERRTHSIPSENRSLDNVSAAPCYRLTVARSRNTKNNTENRKVFQFDVHRVSQRTPGKYRPAFVHTLYCVVCERRQT